MMAAWCNHDYFDDNFFSEEFFCEYDTDTDAEVEIEDGETRTDTGVHVAETAVSETTFELNNSNRGELTHLTEEQQVPPPVEIDDTVYRLGGAGESTSAEEKDEFYTAEKNFINSSRELIDTALCRTETGEVEQKLSECEYLNICNIMKTIFTSHKSMVHTLIQINHELTERVQDYSALLKDSEDLNREISNGLEEFKSNLHQID